MAGQVYMQLLQKRHFVRELIPCDGSGISVNGTDKDLLPNVFESTNVLYIYLEDYRRDTNMLKHLIRIEYVKIISSRKEIEEFINTKNHLQSKNKPFHSLTIFQSRENFI